MNRKRIAIFACLAALFSMCALTAKGWQISHGDLAERLGEIQREHGRMMVDLSVTDEKLRDIDRQLAELNTEKLNERLVRLESTSESTIWFLRAILVPLGFLCLERLLAHTGVIPKKG